MELLQRAGGAVIPVVTTIFAFVMAMLVIAATGHNPFTAFKGIFNGTGLNWFFPWVLGDERTNAAFNLQQTLILTASLILAGLARLFRLQVRPLQYRRATASTSWARSSPSGSARRGCTWPAGCTSSSRSSSPLPSAPPGRRSRAS